MDYKYLKKESPKKRVSSAKTSDRNTCYVFESQCGGQCVWRGVIKELNDLRGQRDVRYPHGKAIRKLCDFIFSVRGWHGKILTKELSSLDAVENIDFDGAKWLKGTTYSFTAIAEETINGK